MTVSGWCNDGFHEKCALYYFGKFETTCTCECHE